MSEHDDGASEGAAGQDESQADVRRVGRIARHTDDDPYVESPVIMTAVRIVAPFVLTYGLFITFHGASTPGGGFQGGAVMGTVVLMLAFAFGIESTRRWLRNRVIVGLVCGGVALFTLIGLGAIALGGRFLEYPQYGALLDPIAPLPDNELVLWGMEAVEIGGIAAIVSGVIIGLFFVTAAGWAVETAAPARPSTATDDGGDRS